MDRLLKLISLTVFLTGFVSCSVLPVDRCNLEDSACMGRAFQTATPLFCDGLPDLGVEVLDPMEMDDLAFDLSGLQFTLTEGRLKGLKQSVIDRVKWDTKKHRLTVDYHVNCTVRGHYTAGGRLLILPINGDGQLRLKLRNVQISLFIDFKTEKDAEGKTHAKPIKYDFTFDVKDNAHFNLTGLFNGNKELSDTMLTFLNQNWKQVSLEFGRPMMDGAAKKLFKNIIAFFQVVPLDDIADF